MKTNNRTCIITENAVQYLLLLTFAFSVTGGMAWFYLAFIDPWVRLQ